MPLVNLQSSSGGVNRPTSSQYFSWLAKFQALQFACFSQRMRHSRRSSVPVIFDTRSCEEYLAPRRSECTLQLDISPKMSAIVALP